MARYLYLSIPIVLCLACGQATDLPHIDEAKWRVDNSGCNGYRAGHTDDIKKDKDLLKGMNQNEVIEILGKPDENELYTRNQKFFIYHLTPRGCNGTVDSSPGMYLSIRFNATGLAKEVVVYYD